MTNINNYKLSTLSISTLYDPKNKNSFCWKHFGVMIHEENHKRSKICEEQVFCQVCLDNLKNENNDISFGLYLSGFVSQVGPAAEQHLFTPEPRVKIKSYSKTVSTGNLLRHLKDDHNIRDESVDKTKPITDFFTPRPRKSVCGTASTSNPIRQKKDKWLLARDLALWFCKSLLPFDTVSDEGTIDFFQKYNIIISKDDLPSSDTVGQTALSDVYESMLRKIKAQIVVDASRHVALTFDLWTDGYRRLNYITFTLHYIAADFELKSFTLCTNLIGGKKTGEKIKDYIDKLKEDYNLQDREIHTVTDAGSNVKRAVTLSHLDGHLCLGHGLHNLVTVDGLQKVPEIVALIEKCKRIVKLLRYRLPELEANAEKEQKEILMACQSAAQNIESDEADPIPVEDEEQHEDSNLGQQELFGNPNNVPSIKTASPTRWHSVLIMLESLAHCCNRAPVNEMLTKIGQSDIKINAEQWNILEDLIKFLRTFLEAVEMLSSQKVSSLNLALIFRSEIEDVLLAMPDDESLIIQRLRNQMLLRLDKRFPVTENIVAASLLDPRFASLKDIDTYVENHQVTKTTFLTEVVKKFVKESDKPAESVPASKKNQDVLLQKLAKKHSNRFIDEDDEVAQECWRYLATANPSDLGDVEGNILKFWEQKRNVFPWLAGLARSLLAIPATSTPSERVFSVAGLVLTAKRSRLNPAKVNKIIFIHDNYKHCQ